MRPAPSRIVLAVIAIAAFAAGALSANPFFFLLALGSGAFLVISLSTGRRPLTRALLRFKGHPVHVRLWGAPPPAPSGALVLTAVNTLGAGTHLFFSTTDGASVHLKIAQPEHPTIGADSVVIGAARYVQWNGKRIPKVGPASAVSVVLTATLQLGHPAPVPRGP